jgi:hypothetical protein
LCVALNLEPVGMFGWRVHVGHENSYQIAIKSLFCPICRIASYNTQEATYSNITSIYVFQYSSDWPANISKRIFLIIFSFSTNFDRIIVTIANVKKHYHTKLNCHHIPVFLPGIWQRFFHSEIRYKKFEYEICYVFDQQ